MGTALHEAYVLRTGVAVLAVGYGVHKPVAELLVGPQEVGLDKVDHGIVWNEKHLQAC